MAGSADTAGSGNSAVPTAIPVPSGASRLGGILQLRPDGDAPMRQGGADAVPTAATPGPAAATWSIGSPEPLPQQPHAAGAPASQRPPARLPASPAAAASVPLSLEAGRGPSAAAPSPEPGVLVRQANPPAAALPSPQGSPDSRGVTGTATPAASGETHQRELVLDRRQRQLLVIDNGTPLRRFPVAVGMPGWETPVGRFRVLEMQSDPTWEHPVSGLLIRPGPDNPLGSRWIGFHRDCSGRSGFNGQEHLVVEGCVVAGFHGTPNRASIGQAVSHGCVRLFDEHVRELFDLVRLGTPVTVLP